MKVLLDVPLTYEVSDGSVHTPMVEAVVGSRRTKLIVDSGSTDHVLTVELADAAGVAYTPGEPGTDLTGESVPSWHVGALTIAVARVPVALRDVVAIRGPGPFEAWGIGGFLSPQRLWPAAHVVFDLVANRLTALDGASGSVDAWVRQRHPDLRAVDVSRHAGGTLGVAAEIVPFGPHPALLDSGSGSTDVARAAVPGLLGVGGDSGAGVSGTVVEADVVADQSLRVGPATFALAQLHIRDHLPPPEGLTGDDAPQGLLGMDVLRGTVLAVGPADGGGAQWFVPPAR